MGNPRSRVLFVRLLLPFSAVIVVAFGVCAWIAIHAGRRSVESMARANLDLIAHATLDGIEKHILEHSRELQAWGRLSIMDDILIEDRSLRIEHLLLELKVEREAHYLQLEVSDRQGRIVASTDASRIGRTLQLVRAFVETSWVTGRMLVVRPEFEDDLTIRDLEIAAPIVSRLSGESIGWIVGHLDWDPVERIVARAESVDRPRGPGRFLLLTDERGIVLAGDRTRVVTEGIGVPSEDNRVDLEAAKSGVEGVGPFLVSQAMSPSIGSLFDDRVRLLAFWRRDDAFGVLRVFMGSVVGAALLGVALAVGASYVTARSLTDRILRLRDGTARLAEGDLSHRVPDQDDDELGELARSFNMMGDRLAAAQGRAEAATARWRALVEHAPDIIVTVDPTGEVVFVNRTLPGLEIGEVVGTPVFDWIAPAYRSGLRAVIERVLATGGVGRLEAQGVGSHREPVWYDLRVGPVRQDGSIVAANLIATDITEKRKLAEEVLEVSERERERIGRDLHDGLGQILTGVSLLARGLNRRLVAHAPREARDADQIECLIRDAIQQTRQIARGLYPIGIAEDGLRSALEDLAAVVESAADVTCRVEGSFATTGSDPFRATHLFRIVQEATSNALRHGRATEITIRLFDAESDWGLAVEDNGVGIPDPVPRGSGMGLRLMHYRAAVAGGTLDVETRRRGGTRVKCSFSRSPVGAGVDVV